jgi:REP element-mobilizing transposase RayT
VRNSRPALQRGRCIGFIVMPDHVHAIGHFPAPDPISGFMKQRGSVPIQRPHRGTLSS